MFRKSLASLIVLAAVAGVLTSSALADPVDLRDKKGVVDPADLKKSNPPQRGLHINEPPPPSH